MIRYSDVLLMHAEAAFHSGDENAARTSFNLVRRRVKIPDVTASGNDLLKAIYRERRLELGLEAHRFLIWLEQAKRQKFWASMDSGQAYMNCFLYQNPKSRPPTEPLLKILVIDHLKCN